MPRLRLGFCISWFIQVLIPKQTREHGIPEGKLEFRDEAVDHVISAHTREAGVRNLERQIASICRKVAMRFARGKTRKITITPKKAKEMLGAPAHHLEELLAQDRVGVATGLAWTAAGGDLMFIEVLAVPGKGNLLLTGQLGEVMKESAQAALSYAKACAAEDGEEPDFFTEHDIHVHVPAGSIPKDGPSAGITIATALISLLREIPVNRRVAMTGEITLRGSVLPIGGLKEKILAAKTAGIDTVILPKLNQADLAELPDNITEGITFHLADEMADVLARALLDGETPKSSPERKDAVPAAG